MIAPTAGPPLSAAKLIDPKALMTVRSLELRARAVVEGFWNGLHRSPYHGFSVEFTEYRQYSSGDDPRYLDWRVFARSDRFFIKKFEDETNLRCHLLVDQSRSMAYGSRGYTKSTYAATLAATFGYFLHLQGDAVGLLTFDEAVREFLPARNRQGHLRQLMIALEKETAGRTTNLTTPLERMMTLVRKRGMVILLSDFLAPVDRLERNLMALTAAGHEAHVFQLLDPVELNLGLEKASLFEDIETQQQVYIDPAAARAEYMKKMDAHCDALRGMCRKLGVGYFRRSTAEPLEIALYEFLQQRMKRGRQFRAGRGLGGRR